MDATNASVYDGASCRGGGRCHVPGPEADKAVVSGAAHPDVIATIQTYCFGAGTEVVVAPVKDGRTDLTGLVDDQTALRIHPAAQLLRPAGGRSRSGPDSP